MSVRRARKYGIPVVAIVGSIEPGAEGVYEEGIDAMISIAPGPITLGEPMKRAGDLIAEAASTTMRLLKLGQQIKKGTGEIKQ